MGRTVSKSCPVAGFTMTNDEPSGSTVRDSASYLVN
jgi:hypothetical protein